MGGFIGFIATLLLIIGITGSSIVGAGEVGVVTTLGKVSQTTLDSGYHFINPISWVSKIDVRIQKEEADASAASKDLQTVNAKVALNYHILPSKARDLFLEVRKDYKVRLIQPALQEAVKAATATFTAEELITKRPEVSQQVKLRLMERLESRGIIVDEFSILNFDFSPSFNQAIEAKVTAEQNALAAKNKLEQVKYEAQQQIEQAKGKAEAIAVEAAALQQNQQIVSLRAIEKWSGDLPQYVGAGAPIPFLDIQK